MRGAEALMDEVVVQQRPKLLVERLTGYVEKWMRTESYGFIRVSGMKGKQFHFHKHSLKRGVSPAAIGKGVVVQFTPAPSPAPGKCDKATEVEVVG